MPCTQLQIYNFIIIKRCNTYTSIQYYLTRDDGHAWPGGLPGSAIGDSPSKVINANNLIWEFFQQY
ncbi:MAG: hypothetical protein WKF89_03470 [Chitinophagaceae bacterium]